MKKLFSHLKEYRIYALLTPLFLIGEVAMEVTIPTVMASIVDEGLHTRNIDLVVSKGIIMIIMALFALVCAVIGARLAATSGTGLARNLRGATFGKVQDFSFSNVEKFSTASLLTRLTTDITNIQDAFIVGLRFLGRSPIMLVSAVFMAMRISRKITMIFLLAIPVILVGFIILARMAMPRFQQMLTELDSLNGTVQENFSGIRVVKAYVREFFENEKFEAAARRVRNAQARALQIIVVANPLMQLVIYSCIIGIFWFGGQLTIQGELSPGAFISLFAYMTQILMSLIMIAAAFIQIAISRASVVRVAEVLGERIGIQNRADPITTVEDGSIEFDNVNFRYSGEGEQFVFKNLNLSIKSGETVGIIGGTGSAKSTLVQMIPRLYDTSSGSVRVGGINVKDYDLHILRESVAMVLQKNILFSGTIRENLQWGNPTASDDELDRVCKIAQATEFIHSFPDGYDTWLERGGVNLSGGQKQRLCIARALLKHPKVIILDDSTSAVDTTTDASIRSGLRTSLGDTTAIIVAQRISSVDNADKIIVMDQGQIDGFGTHEELLETNAIYREIYHSQTKGVA